MPRKTRTTQTPATPAPRPQRTPEEMLAEARELMKWHKQSAQNSIDAFRLSAAQYSVEAAIEYHALDAMLGEAMWVLYRDVEVEVEAATTPAEFVASVAKFRARLERDILTRDEYRPNSTSPMHNALNTAKFQAKQRVRGQLLELEDFLK